MDDNPVLKLVTNYKKSAAVIAGIEVGLFEELKKGNYNTIPYLAKVLNVTPQYLRIMLKYFESQNMVQCVHNKWILSEKYRPYFNKIKEYKNIIRHEGNIFSNWMTPDKIIQVLHAQEGKRLFDNRGWDKEELKIYKQGMYGKNIELINFWLKRELNSENNIQLLEYGRSGGVIAEGLKKQLSNIDAHVVINDALWDIQCSDNEKHSIVYSKMSEFKASTKYDVIIIFNTIHYLDNNKFNHVFEDISSVMHDDTLLCIIDFFHNPEYGFLNGLLLDWLTHGGTYFLERSSLEEELRVKGIEIKKIKQIPTIYSDIIYSHKI